MQKSTSVRAPVVAGSFYPGDEKSLSRDIGRFLSSEPSLGLRGVHAILVPHAGYMYSGQVAAASYREIGKSFKRVFIMAGNHNGDANFNGISLPQESFFSIPGAEISVSKIVGDLEKKEYFVKEPLAHINHTIEVQLPFLNHIKGSPKHPDFEIIPMVTGYLTEKQIASITETLSAYVDNDTLFIFSADLSHYHRDDEAKKLDAYSLDALMGRNLRQMLDAETCGSHALAIMLSLAKKHGWEPTLIKHLTSGDVSGDRSRVVGYGSVAFHEKLSLIHDEKKQLLEIARTTIEEFVREKKRFKTAKSSLDKLPILRIPRGAFVTLKKKGDLRGCIGDLKPDGALFLTVEENAISAASRDPRFSPVTPDELKDIEVSISILDYPELVTVSDPSEYPKVLKPNVDGVIIQYNGRQSTYLPQVWEQLPEPKQFLSSLCQKQGSPSDCWQNKNTILYKYSGFEFGEKEFDRKK